MKERRQKIKVNKKSKIYYEWKIWNQKSVSTLYLSRYEERIIKLPNKKDQGELKGQKIKIKEEALIKTRLIQIN